MSRKIRQPLAVALLSMAILLLVGCPYESDIPLSSPGEARVDGMLIGTWRSTGEGDDGFGMLTIFRFNDHEIVIVIEEKGGTQREILRGFTTYIDKERFLNIQGIEGPYDKRKWMYLNYSITKDALSYRVLCDSFVKEKTKGVPSSKELYRLIQENLTNKDLYDKEETTLKRVDMK